jgi:amidase
MDRRDFLKKSTALGLSLASPSTRALELKTMAGEITSMSASSLSRTIRRREVACEEVMQAYLQRIHRYNPVYNAIVSLVDDADLLSQARLADKALQKDEYWGWMHGMPHAVKDLADARG